MTYSLFKRVQSILLCAMMMISLYYTCVFSCKQLQRERIRVEALPEQIYKELSDTLGYTVDFIVGKMSLSFCAIYCTLSSGSEVSGCSPVVYRSLMRAA